MPLRLLLLLALVLSLGACDSYDDEDDTSLQVFVADFQFDADDYEVTGFNTASFSAEDAQVTRGDLADALQTAGSGDMVMLYIASELVNEFETNDDELLWSALPITRAVNVTVPAEGGGEIDVIDYIVSYEYSFTDQALFFDVVSSLPYDAFSDDPDVLFDTILPARFNEAPSDLFFRLVVIPEELFLTNGAAARIDMRDYEAVKRAYNLPD